LRVGGVHRHQFVNVVPVIGAALLLSACEIFQSRPEGQVPRVEVGPPLKSEAWKAVATDADEGRLDRLGLAWQEGLEEAKKSNPGDVKREGQLLNPRAAQPRPAPTPGSYYCRLIKLGRSGEKGKTYESFKPFFCYIETEDELFTIVKQTGSQRPSGRLWEDDDATRLIFLGSLALADEEEAAAYGENPKRDMAGVFERIAPFKWRLVIPWPQSTSKLDVFELTPVPEQPK
jgi:hypothetical protein